ncbi:D-inositol-3-phosphate glycosyltransferase [bioreactor metagenome]|uniref:D-inositol-3-phosphate glycosyltransferase n=1 Tax=bioreactor metagenome TaxID=1076179 RepID=A0A644XDD0_9ZZZZ
MSRILMATMGLELGGAETHIVELCRHLRRAGHEIVLCSAGGALVPELEASGVRHVTAPLASRSLSSMSKAYGILSQEMRAFKPDIVHAHARIPGFLLSSLCRRDGVPLVTTVHGSYKVSASLRFLTRWGAKQLAVSEDIRDYLTENYHIAGRDIFVTVNGIDADAFCPGDAGDLRHELGIGDTEPVVVTVSRLDDDSSAGVRRLLDEVTGVKVVVVGGGTNFEELRDKYPKVIFVGPRRDVVRFCRMADVFVGVSRSALEAMACEKPVVLAGNAGYMGILSPDTYFSAKSTNLTCRGKGQGRPGDLAADVAKLLSDAEWRVRLGKWGRVVVQKDYSIDRMTQDSLRCYRAALLEKKGATYDFLLCGYYGYGNSGDEMLLSTIVRNLTRRDKEVHICVLNRDRAAISCVQDVALARRFSLPEVISAMRRSKVLVFGGGNLLQDVTSVKSLVYYLTLLRLAKGLGLKTMLYGNGIGPLRSSVGRRMSKSVLTGVDLITLRDPDSARLLRELGVPDDHILLTADEVFTAFDAPLPKSPHLPKGDYIAVSLRAWKDRDPDFDIKVAAALDRACDDFKLPVVFVPLQQAEDTPACQAVAALMKNENVVLQGEEEDVLSAITSAKAVVGMRLHALIFAAAAGVPSCGIVYDPKVEAFFSMTGSDRFVNCSGFVGSRFTGFVREILQDDGKKTKEVAVQLAEAAAMNSEAAFKLLRGKL